MVKEAIDVSKVPLEEVAELVREFGMGDLSIPPEKLFGGSNFKVMDRSQFTAVLKVCHSYTKAEVEGQARMQGYLGQAGFKQACAALPLRSSPEIDRSPELTAEFVTTSKAGDPAMMLTFCDGKAADAVIEGGADAGHVLEGIEYFQVPLAEGLRRYEDGACCDLGKHVSGEFLPLLRGNKYTKDHPYTKFYEEQRDALELAVKAQGLPLGILHGDPFLDNILVDPNSGDFKAFVDFEDACVGPLLFDVACCAAANCYRQSDNTLNVGLLRRFLRGYTRRRSFHQTEIDNFIPFMKVALLCNCSWRFMNFNIHHREIENCRNAHVELQNRII
eukprot:gene10815-12797_t